jgi:hypothetical protein
MDSINFNIYLPFMLIIFAAIGWILATGVQKSQYVRVIDVLLYGPYLIYLSLKKTYTFTYLEKVFLLFFGTTTITYNLRNLIGNMD